MNTEPNVAGVHKISDLQRNEVIKNILGHVSINPGISAEALITGVKKNTTYGLFLPGLIEDVAKVGQIIALEYIPPNTERIRSLYFPRGTKFVE